MPWGVPHLPGAALRSQAVSLEREEPSAGFFPGVSLPLGLAQAADSGLGWRSGDSLFTFIHVLSRIRALGLPVVWMLGVEEGHVEGQK